MPPSRLLPVLCLLWVHSHTVLAQPEPRDRDYSGLAEVVVTAQRRSENIQDVPIAISVVNGQDAERLGVSGTDSLQLAVPGLILNRQSGSGGAPFLRGVGTNTGVAGAELPVAIYVDDVYLGSPLATIFPFAALEQAEVLKGPQGTLFGRNATGGVILLRTRRPSRIPESVATIGYGRFGTSDASLYANRGVTDKLAMNFAAIGEYQSRGYGYNVTRIKDVYRGWNYGLRGSVLWQPDDRGFALFSADYSDLWSDIGGMTIPYPGSVSSGGARNIGRLAPSSGQEIYSEFGFSGASVRVERDVGPYRVVSITASRATRQHGLFDQDLAPINLIANDTRSRTTNFSQELQLQSGPAASAHWILGGYYLDSLARFRPLRTLGLSQGANVYTDLRDSQRLHSYAAFADARFAIWPVTHLTLGLRYTTDQYHLDVEPRTNAAGAELMPGFSTSDTFSKLTYRAILDRRLAEDVLAYASYSRGFKSGGYNLSTPGNPPTGLAPVSPEVLDAAEVGLKSEYLDKQLRVNLAAFRYDYKDLQVNIVVPPAILINAGSAVMQGLDFDITAVAIDHLTISFGGSWLDDTYRNFARGPLYVPRPAICSPVPLSTGPPTGGNAQCSANLSGHRTIRSPNFTGDFAATYTTKTRVGEVSAAVIWYRNSGFFWEPDNRIRQNPYDLLNSSLSWAHRSGRLALELWGRNLLNDAYYDYGAESPQADQVTPAAPRTYGISVTMRY